MAKKLYKVYYGKMLGGVCAGVAEYFNIDPSIVRILWAALSLCYGFGIILYLICVVVLPYKDDIVD